MRLFSCFASELVAVCALLSSFYRLSVECRCDGAVLAYLVVVTDEVWECTSLVGLLESVSVALLAERLSSQSRHVQEICCEKSGENRTSFFEVVIV